MGVLAAVIVAMPSNALADGIGTVGDLSALGGGTTMSVSLVGNPALCSSVSGGQVWFADLRVGNGGVTADGLKTIYSTLLAAKLAGKTITLYAINGTSSSFGCIVTGVYIH